MRRIKDPNALCLIKYGVKGGLEFKSLAIKPVIRAFESDVIETVKKSCSA